MNSTAKVARGAAVVASVAWAAALFFLGLNLNSTVQKALGYLPTLIGLAVVAFDLWAWKWPLINRAFPHPRIYGTWRAVLTPNSKSDIPAGGNWGPITAALVIEQTFWTISARLYTQESGSSTVTAAFVSDRDSRTSRTLYATYSNTATQQHNARSYPHSGSFRLHVSGTTPDTMDGIYWTDRLTAGDLTARRINRTTDSSREAALADVAASASLGQ